MNVNARISLGTLLGLAGLTALAVIAGCGVGSPLVAADNEPVMTGDLNGDGVVTQADLDLASEAFGRDQSDPLFQPGADFDGDGVIGLTDLQTLIGILEEQAATTGA